MLFRLLGMGQICLGLLLLTQFGHWRSQLAAGWLALGALLWWRGSGPVLVLWVSGWLGLLALAPGRGPGCLASPFLRFSPFNLFSERDLSNLGITLFYNSPRVREAVRPIYDEMETRPQYGQMCHAVAYSANDLFGLGTGSGHLFYTPKPPGRKLLFFLHGAMGNLQCYTSYWQTYAEEHGYTVVCPTFGFSGAWWRPGGLETAEAAWKYAHEQLGVAPEGAMVVGLSNGATGAVRLVMEHPAQVEQLVLISPVLEPEVVGSDRFARALQRPPLILEGDEDVNVTPAAVEQGVAAMRDAGLKPRYELLRGHAHFLMFTARATVFQSL
ncbi:hypothetical protein ABS71_11075 [bacterium SCN 62-11]|nr:alpha/beta hydrolase [Candidatus Eremiobacteraeota bacterium]ODT67289.1 MAG: hypothetical protein ABS71_11075 [bacterium SCN 62-11]